MTPLAAKPLTAPEQRQLAAWDRTLGNPRRAYGLTAGLALVVGGGLGWLIAHTAVAQGGPFRSVGEQVPFLRGVERVLGPVVTTALVAGLLFGVAMVGMVWQLRRVMRAQAAGYRAREWAAGMAREPAEAARVQAGPRPDRP